VRTKSGNISGGGYTVPDAIAEKLRNMEPWQVQRGAAHNVWLGDTSTNLQIAPAVGGAMTYSSADLQLK